MVSSPECILLLTPDKLVVDLIAPGCDLVDLMRDFQCNWVAHLVSDLESDLLGN